MESICQYIYRAIVAITESGTIVAMDNASGGHNNFTTAGAVHLEHIMLTGQTVVDGPGVWTTV